MDAQFTPYTPVLVLSAAVSVALAAYGWRFRSEPGGRWFALTTAAAGVWSLTYALELSATTLSATAFWSRVGWIPYELLLVGLLLFSLELAGHERWITRRTLPVLLLWPSLTVVLAFTAPVHDLFYTGARLEDAGGFVVLEHVALGPWYWIETAWGFTVALVALGLFVRRAATETGLYRKQATVMAVGIALPVLAAVVDVASPVTPARLTPLFFVPTGVLFAWGLVRYRVLDLVPLARELAVEHMNDAVVVLDAADRLVDYNPAAASLFGLSETDLGAPAATATGVGTGGDDSGTTLPDDGETIALDGADGRRYFEIDCVAVRDGRGGASGRLCLLHDVSERRNRERWLRTLTENASDVVAVVGADARVRYVGQSAEARLGCAPRTVVGRDVRSMVHPDDRDRMHEAFDALVGDPGGERRGEYRIRHADGDHRTFEVRSTNLLDDPVVSGVVVNAHDVTERKARERRLQRQNEQLDAFASVVSHDLRNPLNVADGYLDLAREDAAGETPHLDRVADAHDRLGDILDDVLALARNGGEVGETSTVSIESAATDAWETVATDGATLTVARDGSVEADRTRLLRLFENLFRNSLEHGCTSSRPGAADPSEHGVAGEEGDEDRDVKGEGNGNEEVAVTVGALPDGDGFYVEDDGPGVPPDARDRVFESGYTTADDGTGLGLAIVRAVAEGHGWTPSLADDPGGARFEFRTGVDAPEGDRTGREESSEPPTGGGIGRGPESDSELGTGNGNETENGTATGTGTATGEGRAE